MAADDGGGPKRPSAAEVARASEAFAAAELAWNAEKARMAAKPRGARLSRKESV